MNFPVMFKLRSTRLLLIVLESILGSRICLHQKKQLGNYDITKLTRRFDSLESELEHDSASTQ